MKKKFIALCIWGLLITNAFGSDNAAVMAYARKNAEKYKIELVKIKGIALGSTVTLQGKLDEIDVKLLETKYDPDNHEMVIESSVATLNSLMFSERCKRTGAFVGQNAFGAKAIVQRQTCERFFARDGDVMGVPILEQK